MKRTALLIFMLFLLAGCKYKHGPLVSFKSATERIAKKWKFDKVTLYSADYTNEYVGASIEFTPDGLLYVDALGQQDTGTWVLMDNRKVIKLEYPSYFRTWDIIKLTQGKLKSEEILSGGLGEFTLVPY